MISHERGVVGWKKSMYGFDLTGWAASSRTFGGGAMFQVYSKNNVQAQPSFGEHLVLTAAFSVNDRSIEPFDIPVSHQSICSDDEGASL